MTDKNLQNDIKNDQPSEKQDKSQEAILKEFMEKHTKELPFNGVSLEFAKQLKLIIEDLKELRVEVEEKKETFSQQNEVIKKKLSDLTRTGKFNIDKDEFEKSQQGLEQYKKMLENVVEELDSELAFCQGLISDQPPETIRVLNTATDDIDLYLKEKLNWLKKYVKKIKKDLRISFSKYNFSFENQIKKLEYFQHYLKAIAAGKIK